MLSDSLGVIVGRTLDKLVPFVSNKGLQRGTAERDSRLRSIFVLAVRMDQEINMQFASYFLAIPRSADQLRTPFGFLFNSEEMKVDATMAVRDGREKCDFVGLVVAPTLFVKGDPNGGNFLEPATVLEKCTVMPRSALSRKSHRDADAEHKGSRKRAESQRPKGSYSRMWI